MKKSIQLLKKGFESTDVTTPQFLKFYSTFKKEFIGILQELGASSMQIGKGHFYISGFFKINDQCWYFSISDVRSFKSGDSFFGSMLIRTARDYKDYTGGTNRHILLDENFQVNLRNLLLKHMIETAKEMVEMCELCAGSGVNSNDNDSPCAVCQGDKVTTTMNPPMKTFKEFRSDWILDPSKEMIVESEINAAYDRYVETITTTI